MTCLCCWVEKAAGPCQLAALACHTAPGLLPLLLNRRMLAAPLLHLAALMLVLALADMCST